MDETLWHQCKFPIWPIKRGPDGKLFLIAHNGKFWRRRVNDKWQYTQDRQTKQEWIDAIW